MIFESPLLVGRFLKRYQRFFADVELEGGEVVTAHVANTGSMMGIAIPGAPAALMRSDNPARKLAFTLEMIQVGDAWVGVNTSRPNQVVEEAIALRRIPELARYSGVRREVKYGNGSRIDLLLTEEGHPPCYVEVKNVTLREDSRALFPDAVTSRGKKHLEELEQVVREGSRGVMVFLVNRRDCTSCGVADGIDPEYGECLRRVQACGVELLAYQTELSLTGIHVIQRLPVNLDLRSSLRR